MPDDTLRITTVVDVGAISSGMKEAASAVTSSGGQMEAAFEEAAAASRSLDVASTKAAGSVGRMGGAMGAARVEAAALTGSTGMLAGGLARMAAQSSALAPLLMAAFPVAAIAAFGSVFSNLYEEWSTKQKKIAQGWQSIDNSLVSMDTQAVKALGDVEVKTTELTQGPIAALRLQIQLMGNDTAGMAEQFKKALDEMTAQLKLVGPSWWEFLTPGTSDIQTKLQGMSIELQKAFNTGDAKNGLTELDKQLNDLYKTRQKLEADAEAFKKSVTIETPAGPIMSKGAGADPTAQLAAINKMIPQLEELQRITALHVTTTAATTTEKGDQLAEAAIQQRITLIKSEAEAQEKLAVARADTAKASAVEQAAPHKLASDDEEKLAQSQATQVFEIKYNALQQQIAAYSQFSGKYSTQIKELGEQQVALTAEYGAKINVLQADSAAAQTKDLDAWAKAFVDGRAKAYADDLKAEQKFAADKLDDARKLDEQLQREQKEANADRPAMAKAQEGQATAGLESGPIKTAIQGAFIKQEQEMQQAALQQATASVGTYVTQLQAAQAALDKLTASGANESTASEKDRAAWEAANNELLKTKSGYDQAVQSQTKLIIQGMELGAQAKANAVSFQTAWINAIQQTTNAFNSSFIKWVDNGGSAWKMLTSMGESATNSIIGWALKETEVKLANWATQTAAKNAQATASLPASIAAAKAEAASLAGLAGAGGVASMAAAPFPLDLTAPEFGAAMLTAAMSFAAFEEGGIVGATQLALVHKNEMVLPAHISEGIQRNIGGGDGSGGKGGTTNHHYHFNTTATALDSAGMDRVLRQNEALTATHFARQVRRMNR